MRKMIPMAFLGAALLIGCPPVQQGEKKPGEGSATAAQAVKAAPATGEKVTVELYIMSKCPYGAQTAIPMIDAMEQLKGAMDLQIEYITREEGGEFKSLHGPTETQGNIDQLCARAQDPTKAYAFIKCVSEKFQAVPENTAECATKVGLDAGALQKCSGGEQGKTLLRESIAKANAAQAMGSPTIKIAGKPYRQGRTPRDIMRAVCAEMKSPNDACAAIPPPVPVKMIALSDARCVECKTTRYESQLKTYFPGLEVESVDWGTERGKEIFKKTGLKYLPAILFDESVTKGEAYQQFEKRFQKMDVYYYLPIKATFDPTAEICDNKIEDNGDGKIDCDDATCKENLVCRPERKGELAVFIMSQCPYGVRAVDAMKPVLETLGNKVDFKIHYIADKTETGFRALHGQSEVDENIRQLCAAKKYPKKHLDYVWCRNKDYRSAEWQKCATGGIDPKVIQKCAEGDEGKALLAEDIKIAAGLQISASPTWLANNRYKFSGIQSEQIKNQWCKYNEGTKGCDTKIQDAAGAGAPVPAGACGK